MLKLRLQVPARAFAARSGAISRFLPIIALFYRPLYSSQILPADGQRSKGAFSCCLADLTTSTEERLSKAMSPDTRFLSPLSGVSFISLFWRLANSPPA